MMIEASPAARATAIAKGRDPAQTTAARAMRRDSLLAAKAAWVNSRARCTVTE